LTVAVFGQGHVGAGRNTLGSDKALGQLLQAQILRLGWVNISVSRRCPL
jgi:hypothetical protein